MTESTRDMNPNDKSDLGRLALEAMQAAADGVVEEARRTHGTVVIWEDGAVRHIPADQLPQTRYSGQPSPLPWGDGI